MGRTRVHFRYFQQNIRFTRWKDCDRIAIYRLRSRDGHNRFLPEPYRYRSFTQRKPVWFAGESSSSECLAAGRYRMQ